MQNGLLSLQCIESHSLIKHGDVSALKFTTFTDIVAIKTKMDPDQVLSLMSDEQAFGFQTLNFRIVNPSWRR